MSLFSIYLLNILLIHTFVKGASFQPFFWTITTAPFGTCSFFRGLLPLKIIIGGSIFPDAVQDSITVKCFFCTGRLDSDLSCSFFMHSARCWHVKICWSLIHVDDQFWRVTVYFVQLFNLFYKILQLFFKLGRQFLLYAGFHLME